MIGFYAPLLILQAFCVYHAYRHNVEQRWYWFIIFFPGIGCALYLYNNFYNRSNIQKITESVKGVINTDYKLELLEKALQFSDNVTNKINLADAYVAYGRYTDAVKLYEDCLTGYMADDPLLRMKVLNAYYSNQDFDSTIHYGALLEPEKQFKDAEQRIDYAWALHRSGKTDIANAIFSEMNKSFTNYRHRVEFCKFLIETDRSDDLRGILVELVQELEYMKGPERRLYKDVIREIRELQAKYLNTK